jgi:hypothetical protein
MITINVSDFVGRDGIQSVNENEFFYEFNLDTDKRVVLHKRLTGDKITIETDGNAIMIELVEITNIDSIINHIKSL